MSTDNTVIRNHVHAHVPGCPLPLIDQAIKDSIFELFRKAYIWKADLAAIDVVAGQEDYDLTDPVGAKIVTIVLVTLDDQVLSLGHDYTVSEDGLTITLLDVPDEAIADGLVVNVALAPDAASTSLEDRFFNEYYEVIAHGAKSRLMVSPKKPWTDAGLAKYHDRKFKEGIEAAKIALNFGGANTSLRVKLPNNTF